MAIYVKDLHKPESCKDCHFFHMATDTSGELSIILGCAATGEMSDQESILRYQCPITDVLEPHGPLIDADVLKQNWIFRGPDSKGERETIDEQTVIIPETFEVSEKDLESFVHLFQSDEDDFDPMGTTIKILKD